MKNTLEGRFLPAFEDDAILNPDQLLPGAQNRHDQYRKSYVQGNEDEGHLRSAATSLNHQPLNLETSTMSTNDLRHSVPQSVHNTLSYQSAGAAYPCDRCRVGNSDPAVASFRAICMTTLIESSPLPAWVRAELNKVPAAVAQGKLQTVANLQAVAAKYDVRKKLVVVALANGATFSFPPALAQGLSHARAGDLAVIEITPQGTGLHWPLLDADHTVEGLLAGVFGSRAWSRQHAAHAGRTTSPAKATAARANGSLGGRPRKTVASL